MPTAADPRKLQGFPGIGGSLGTCCLCGKSFMLNLLTGENVAIREHAETGDSFSLHLKCAEELDVLQAREGSWREMRDGPLRRAFEKANEVSDDR